jgi:hypothetical protein
MLNSAFRRAAIGAALVGLIPGIAAAEPQGAGATATLPFRALSAEGQPVIDLKAGDVSLKVDGRAREIKSFELVDLRSTPAPAGAPPAARPGVAPPFALNGSSGKAGRDVYLLVDEESIAPGKDMAVKEAIGHLLSSLHGQDRAALISIRQGGPNLGLTTDFAQVKTTAASLAGFAPGREESAADITCRTVRAIQNIQGVFNVSTGSAAPSTVVFFSTAVAAMQAGRTANIGGASGSELCEIRTEQMNQFGSAAQLARANFYVVELTDSGAASRPQEASGGLENLAGVTSGEIVRVSANAAAQMNRIATSTSAYYLIGFEPESSDRSGNKRVELTVARNGLTVKAPRELSLAKTSGKSGAASPRDMIRVATAFNDLPLRAAAYSSRNPGDNKIRVLALFEAVEASSKLNGAMVGLFDDKGKLTAQWTAQSADLNNRPTMAAVVVPDGTYRLRVAATDASGRSGAVDVNGFAATLIEAGPIKLSDLVLIRPGGTTGGAPVMQFSSESEIVAYLELYGRPTGPLKMYVEVLTDGDPIQVPLKPSPTNEQDKFQLSAAIPVGPLKPGDYTVRAVVGVEGQPEAQVTRTLRKVAAGS